MKGLNLKLLIMVGQGRNKVIKDRGNQKSDVPGEVRGDGGRTI